MKKIAILLVFNMLIQNISFAFIPREITVTQEKIIPFSFISENQTLEESLSIRDFYDAKIKKVYVDNGEANANIDDKYINITFDKGEWANSYKTISKISNIELKDVVLTDESNKKIIITPDREIKSIQEVSGDFKDAKILENGDIEISIKDSAEGAFGYDKESLEKSFVTVNIDDKNTNRRIESDSIVLPYEIVGDIKPKSGDTSNVYGIDVKDNKLKVVFDNGIPKENEATVESGYTYFWIDRDEEGIFKKYNPNSIYSTDINKISGLGKYIAEEEFDEIGISLENSNWKDYCGIEKDGVRYIYVFDKNKGIPNSLLDDVVEDNKIVFDGQELNSEKFSVEFSKAGVSYIPEGKLYSMGELVSNTLGWGETESNKEWESKKTFFNEITGKEETYVKHFKFFYGPKKKIAFGGYYTYPYSCTFEYQHYKPVKLYSGDISYEYESKEKIRGYSYNGWVKIEYKEQKTVNDYPPTAPFNVKYNLTTGEITWGSGKDDYTEVDKLKYEIQIFDGSWKTISTQCFLDRVFNYKINYLEPDVRIRTIDEVKQFSDWAYASESDIELLGELKPYIVSPGDNIDIFATTKSLEKIKNVVAKNAEMQMYLELEKVGESTPNFYEMSFELNADFLEEVDEYFIIEEGRIATGNKEDMNSYRFTEKDKYDNGYVELEFRDELKLGKNGSFIFSNLNYDDIPVNMFNYNSRWWFLSIDNRLYIKNKTTNKKNIFLNLITGTKFTKINNKRVIVPEYNLIVNNLDYNENGECTYKYITVDKNNINKPLAITWNTDVSGITTIKIYMGTELIYTYQASWDKINQHVDNFSSIYMYKQIRKFIKSVYGYINPDERVTADWNKIVLSIIQKYDMREFTWLGYRVRENEYVNQKYVDEYNANPIVRNNYRVLVSDGSASKEAIKRYNDILKVTNTNMTRDEETVFGDDVMEYTSAFQGININIPNTTEPGKYEIELIATDIDGKTAETRLTLIVEEKEVEEPDVDVGEDVGEEIHKREEANVVDKYFGRFFYRDEKGYLETLKKTEKNIDTNGFICAGETIGFYLVATNTDYIEVDFLGNESIKTLDSLTKKFLIDIPSEKGKNTEEVRYDYMNFPKKIYPQYVDNGEIQVFKWFYTVPYKTIQSLESWSSLKNSTLENIDTSKLFDRIIKPYELVIYLNGDRKKGIHLPFDVFERWDTVLNRDITKYVVNSNERWEMRIDK